MAPRPLLSRLPWKGRRVVLGVTGGIAAYKSVQVARDLTQLGADLDVILTRAAESFVTPLTFQGVTGRPVHTRFLEVDGAALHLRLAAEADLVLIAPATADLVARAAHGRADDLLATILLATRAPVVLAPAMNDRMYAHLQTQRNLVHCREVLGYTVVGPATGPLAVGEGEGPGRMLEPEQLVAHAGRALGQSPPFRDRHILVTAGPTREPLDPVRYLGNRSSGRMGFAVAREAWLRGGEVTLVTGPSALPDPVGVTTHRVETASQMLEEVKLAIRAADLMVFAAAVADFRPTHAESQKIKRGDREEGPTLSLAPNPDIALETRALRRPGAVSVGFALETRDLLQGAQTKLRAKGFDLIVANDPGEEGAGFDVPTNRVILLDRDGKETALPLLDKDEVAAAILDCVAPRLEGGQAPTDVPATEDVQ